MAFKLFRSSSEPEHEQNQQDAASSGRSTTGSADAAGERREDAPASGIRALPAAEELPQHHGLPELVALMDHHHVHTLRLDQHGNEMTAILDPSEKPERKTTVDTASAWFDAVAKLYTAAQGSERGPWRRAEIMVANPRDGRRAVEIEYTYPGSERQDREAYVQTVQAPVSDSAEATARPDAEDEAARPSAAGAGSAATAQTPAREAQDQHHVQDQSADDADGAVRDSAAQDGRAQAEPEILGTPAAAQAPDAASSAAPSEADGTEAAAARETGSSDAAVQTTAGSAGLGASGVVAAGGAGAGLSAAPAGSPRGDRHEDASRTEEERPAATEAPSSSADAEPSEVEPVPAVVHDSSWEDSETVVRPEAGRAPESRGETALPDSAPTVAEHADVAPSFHAPAETAAKPSETRLAPGNLVLTEAQVVGRLADAQTALFGPQGTARDVSTVLIRVRALGSYYDALSHVRSNGLWDQRRTFDLVPEEALQVLDLKADSYQEGAGSPVAMMFRFTPGIPPEVSFDYADEESFVQYKDRLPAQQYVEELRMYPRTGANVPQHMNEALSQWTR